MVEREEEELKVEVGKEGKVKGVEVAEEELRVVEEWTDEEEWVSLEEEEEREEKEVEVIAVVKSSTLVREGR